jgi:AsmA protein
MPRPLKIVLVALGALLALLVVAAVVIAATFDPNAYKPQLVALVKQQTQRSLAIPGKIELSFFPSLGARLGALSLSEHRSPAPFASVESARVSLALMPLLRREFVVDRIEVQGLRANLRRFKDGRTNVDDLLRKDAADAGGGTPPTDSGAGAARLDIAGIDVRNAQLSIDDQREGRRVELAVATLSSGRIAPGAPGKVKLDAQMKASSPALDARLQLDGGYLLDLPAQRYAFDALHARLAGTLDKAPIDLTLDVPQLSIDKDVKAQKIEARLRQVQGERSIDARLTLPAFTGTPQAMRTTLSLALDGKQGDRAFQATGDGTLNVDLVKRNATLDLKGKLDASAFTARVWLARFAPLSMRFDVALDALDADRYRSAAATGAAGKTAPEAPIDLSALKSLEMRGTIKVGTLKVAGLQASDVRADLQAAGGRLAVDPISAKLYQGSLTGSAALVAASPPRFAMRQTLTDVQLGPLLKGLTGKDPVEGRGRLALDVTTQGALVSTLKKGLAGTARVELRDGAVRGIDLGRIVSIAGGSGTGSGADKTAFSQLDATFRIAGGVARNDDLLGVSPLMRVTGGGEIDIGNDRLDYLLKAEITGPVSRLQGKTVPVRLRGPFNAIGYSVDVGSVAKEALKERLEKGLGDKLKGLFGR